ncbi:MAG TPA: hypothetical protein VFQ61_07290 [Polyangiaceae bacterium]|nr:hypothetical protein [Polyangiaceae bacterium]
MFGVIHALWGESAGAGRCSHGRPTATGMEHLRFLQNLTAAVRSASAIQASEIWRELTYASFVFWPFAAALGAT